LFTQRYEYETIIQLPIAHGEGNYYCDSNSYIQMKANGQILFEYLENPNGSLHHIAGITNKHGNVLGMMPHPERAVETLLGNTDGLPIFESILQNLKSR